MKAGGAENVELPVMSEVLEEFEAGLAAAPAPMSDSEKLMRKWGVI